jgi:hypothetical protein
LPKPLTQCLMDVTSFRPSKSPCSRSVPFTRTNNFGSVCINLLSRWIYETTVGFHSNSGISWLAEGPLTSQVQLCSMQLELSDKSRLIKPEVETDLFYRRTGHCRAGGIVDCQAGPASSAQGPAVRQLKNFLSSTGDDKSWRVLRRQVVIGTGAE